MTIRSYTFEEYIERVQAFHGFVAPGVVIGGFMVDLAYQHLPEDGLLNAICETPICLPDAIQLLTAKTVGNGRLTVINVGRYAMALFDKETGEGVRVFLDAAKVSAWSEIENWYLKLKSKKEQDEQVLMEQIREAGGRICSIRRVKVADRFLEARHKGGVAVCPRCNEAYPVANGPVCLDCQGEGLYSV